MKATKEQIIEILEAMPIHEDGVDEVKAYFEESDLIKVADRILSILTDEPEPMGAEGFESEKDFINKRYGISNEDHATALELGHIYDLMKSYKQYAQQSPKTK